MLRKGIALAALALGLVAALTPYEPAVRAAGPLVIMAQADAPRDAAPGKSALPPPAKGADAAGVVVPPPPSAPPKPGTAGKPATQSAAPAAADESSDVEEPEDVDVTGDGRRVIIQKGDKRVRVGVFGHDREYDSFEQFVKDAPFLAGLVFMTVLMVFLVPLLIIVLLIWYKVRKNRMANETLLKLAERGIVPTAAAMDAVATGTAASVAEAAATPAAGVPAYEHARAIHRRAVWSDLRKGVILSGIGLGLTFFSLLDDGTPNSVGLIFLFVGLGYGLLWFLEERTRSPQRDAPSTPAGKV
jgi:hypothetical protein